MWELLKDFRILFKVVGPLDIALKRVLHLYLKIKMFCVLSQNYQHFFEQ